MIEAVQLYEVTFAYLLCQFLIIAWLGRSSPPSLKKTRHGSDATWFLGAYFWGVESMYRLANLMGTDIYHNRTDLILPIALQMAIDDLIVPGLAAFVAVLGGSYLAEHLARQRGLASRSSGMGVPPGVIAALLGVQFAWAAFLGGGFSR